MRLRLILFSWLMFVPGLIHAQNQSQLEIFGGFAHGGKRDFAGNGWNASIAKSVSKSVDLFANFAGYYLSPKTQPPDFSKTRLISRYDFLFGPRFAYRRYERWTPFVHLLVGLERKVGGSNQFCVGVGAGLDIRLQRRLSLRINFDNLGLGEGIHIAGYDSRLSAGLVFRLRGSK